MKGCYWKFIFISFYTKKQNLNVYSSLNVKTNWIMLYVVLKIAISAAFVELLCVIYILWSLVYRISNLILYLPSSVNKEEFGMVRWIRPYRLSLWSTSSREREWPLSVIWYIQTSVIGLSASWRPITERLDTKRTEILYPWHGIGKFVFTVWY